MQRPAAKMQEDTAMTEASPSRLLQFLILHFRQDFCRYLHSSIAPTTQSPLTSHFSPLTFDCGCTAL